MSDPDARGDAAVLVSGGIDSAILAIELTHRFSRVIPIYVRFGLRWEAPELAGLREFFGLVCSPRLAPLVVLDEPMAEVYGEHWSLSGPGVPDADSPDEAVYLPGRNLLLVAKASVWCRIRGVETLALGSLESNCFPDASPEFFHDLEAVANQAMGGRLRLIRPFSRLSKAEVIRRGADLPLGSTFSCLDPVEGRHCGACNKCEERRRAFRSVGLDDPTRYGSSRPLVRETQAKGSRCIE